MVVTRGPSIRVEEAGSHRVLPAHRRFVLYKGHNPLMHMHMHLPTKTTGATYSTSTRNASIYIIYPSHPTTTGVNPCCVCYVNLREDGALLPSYSMPFPCNRRQRQVFVRTELQFTRVTVQNACTSTISPAATESMCPCEANVCVSRRQGPPESARVTFCPKLMTKKLLPRAFSHRKQVKGKKKRSTSDGKCTVASSKEHRRNVRSSGHWAFYS